MMACEQKPGPPARRLEERNKTSGGSTHGPHSGPGGQQSLLFGTLFGHERGYIGLLSSLPGERKKSGSIELLEPRSAYFLYPDEVEGALAFAREGDEAGRDLHVCPHLLVRRRRVKENAAPVRALWADADEAALPVGFPEPTLCVESSPGRRHLYWALRRRVEPGRAESLSRRLTRAIGADPSGRPLATLMRLLGARNHKYPGAPLLTVRSHDPTLLYHPREIELNLDPEESEASCGAAGPMHLSDLASAVGFSITTQGGSGAREPRDISALSQRIQALIREGNSAAGKPYKSRSEADFARTIRTASLRNSGGYGGLVLGTSSPFRERSLPSLYPFTEPNQSQFHSPRHHHADLSDD